MDAVVRAPLTSSLSREGGQAVVEVPALAVGINFFPHGGLPLYRIVASLGVLPDMVYHEVRKGFYPAEDFAPVWPVGAASGWLPVKAPRPEPLTLELALPQLPASEAFSLLLCAAIHFGTRGSTGAIVPEKKWGCAKLLRVG